MRSLAQNCDETQRRSSEWRSIATAEQSSDKQSRVATSRAMAERGLAKSGNGRA